MRIDKALRTTAAGTVAAAGVIFSLGLGGCSHGPASRLERDAALEAEREALFEKQGGREPAAEGFLGVLKGADLKLLGDFFQFDTRGKQVRYRVHSKLWTTMDGPYMKEKARKALDEALARTLDARETDLRAGSEAGLVGRLKANLMESFLNEFVYTIRLYKLMNGTLQLDLYFLPEEDSPLDFSHELSSNGLVRLGDTGNLSSRLEKLDEWSFTRQIQQASRLIPGEARLPGVGEGARYVGGVITLNIKILDLNWKPLEKVFPSTKKNAVKGFICYRRYFAGKGPEGGPASCGKDSVVRILDSRFEAEAQKAASRERFLTVDAYQTFNLESLAPKADRIEVFPGRIVAPNKGAEDLLPASSEFGGKTIHAGNFVIQGVTKEWDSSLKFTHRVDGLVYSFPEKKFDLKRSSFWSNAEFASALSPTEEKLMDRKRENLAQVLKDCKGYLIKTFGLERMGRVSE